MNRTSWTISITALIICVIITVLFLVPNALEIRKIHQNNSSIEKETADLTEQIKILNNIQKNKQVENLVSNATNYIPTDPNEDALRQKLTKLTEVLPIQITQLDFNIPTTKVNSINEVNGYLKLNGSLINLIAFIKSIEKSERLITINKINFTQNNTEVTAQIELSAYFKPEIEDDTKKDLAISQSVIDYFSNLSQQKKKP